MADVSQFNVLGDLIGVKDPVARNVDISRAVVDILGDSNAYEFGNTGVLTDKYPNMTVNNRAVYAEGLINGFSRQVSEVDTTNPPDYIIVWIGNNDVRRGSLWGVPQLFLLTRPSRDVTQKFLCNSYRLNISTHTSLAGRDRYI